MDAFAEGYHKGLVEGFQINESSEKRGKWEKAPYLKEGLKWKCSECSSKYTIPWFYCPNCGASMENEEESK